MNRRSFLQASVAWGLLPYAAWAGAYTSSIVVRVKDTEFDAVADALVVLLNASGQFVGFGKTPSDGVYTFYDVPEGNYTVRGFKRGVGKGSDQGTIQSGSGPWYADLVLQ